LHLEGISTKDKSRAYRKTPVTKTPIETLSIMVALDEIGLLPLHKNQVELLLLIKEIPNPVIPV